MDLYSKWNYHGHQKQVAKRTPCILRPSTSRHLLGLLCHLFDTVELCHFGAAEQLLKQCGQHFVPIHKNHQKSSLFDRFSVQQSHQFLCLDIAAVEARDAPRGVQLDEGPVHNVLLSEDLRNNFSSECRTYQSLTTITTIIATIILYVEICASLRHKSSS